MHRSRARPLSSHSLRQPDSFYSALSSPVSLLVTQPDLISPLLLQAAEVPEELLAVAGFHVRHCRCDETWPAAS